MGWGSPSDGLRSCPTTPRWGRVEHWLAPAWLRPDIEVDTRTRLRLENEIVTFFAGPQTEERFTGEPADDGSSSDFRAIVDLASYMVGDEDELNAYIEWLRCRTARHLRTWPAFWPCVQALAEALLQHQTLSGRRARQVILTAGQRWLENH
jgi:hypothetical protein